MSNGYCIYLILTYLVLHYLYSKKSEVKIQQVSDVDKISFDKIKQYVKDKN